MSPPPLRPGVRIAYSERAHDDGGPEQHLEIVNGKLLLVSEDFYDHFAQCCETLIDELPGMTEPKLRNPYLWVGDLSEPRGRLTESWTPTGRLEPGPWARPSGIQNMADTDLRSVIVWFESAEQMLMAVLDVIPYEAVHENVWSPRLVTVLLETCSQLDSLLKQQAVQSPCVASQNLNITDYFALFGQDLSGKWVLFWGESPEKIRPFGAWQGLAGYDKGLIPRARVKWWKAYNKIKHNRIENRREATLRRASRCWAVCSWLSSIARYAGTPWGLPGGCNPIAPTRKPIWTTI